MLINEYEIDENNIEEFDLFTSGQENDNDKLITNENLLDKISNDQDPNNNTFYQDQVTFLFKKTK